MDLLQAELRRIRTTAPSSEEVERAISYFVDGQIVDLETNSARASDLTSRESLYGVAPPRGEFLERLRAVRPPDVLAAARRYLAPEQLTTVMTRFLPDAPLTWMIGLGADAVAAELAGEITGGTAPAAETVAA